MDKDKAQYILQGLASGSLRLQDLAVSAVQELASFPQLTPEAVAAIGQEFGDYPLIGGGLGKNPTIPLEWLKNCWKEDIIGGVLERSDDLDPWIFQDMFWAANQELRIRMVGRDDAPAELLTTLPTKCPNDHHLLTAVAANPKVEADLILAMFNRFGSFSVSGPNQLIAALVGNTKVPLKAVTPFFNHPNATVRQGLAKRPDVGNLEVGLFSLMHDGSDDVRQALAANPHTPAEIALQLLEDSSNAVKYDAVAFGNLPQQKLDELVRSEGITLRNLVMLNSHLAGESPLKLAVHTEFVWRPVKAAKNRIRRCPEAIPAEAAFCRNEGLLGGPVQAPCNQRLGAEVGTWKRLEGKDGAYLIPTGMEGGPDVLREIQRVRFSAQNRREVAGWRPAGKSEWEIFFHDIYGDHIEKERGGTFLLPEASDGWLLGGCDESRDWILGASGRGDHRSVIWAVPVQALKKRTFPAVDLEPRYSEGERLQGSKRTLTVQLVGSLILKNGLFALWRTGQGHLVGWSQEVCADLIPDAREIIAADLDASPILEQTLPPFMAFIREQNSSQLKL